MEYGLDVESSLSPQNDIEDGERAFDPVPHRRGRVQVTSLDLREERTKVLGERLDLGTGERARHHAIVSACELGPTDYGMTAHELTVVQFSDPVPTGRQSVPRRSDGRYIA